MGTFLRRLRGILGIGALWGVAGASIGLVIGVVGVLTGGWPVWPALASLGLGAFSLGAMFGVGFACVLALGEGRTTFDELTPGRAALWGGVAGAGLPFLWTLTVLIPQLSPWLSVGTILTAAVSGSVAYGLLSAGLAAGTVALAKRAPSDSLASAEGFDQLGAPAGRER